MYTVIYVGKLVRIDIFLGPSGKGPVYTFIFFETPCSTVSSPPLFELKNGMIDHYLVYVAFSKHYDVF